MPKVHFDEKRSIKLTNALSKNAKEAITQCNEGMQNQSNKLIAIFKEIVSNSKTKMHFFNFVNEMREKVQMQILIF